MAVLSLLSFGSTRRPSVASWSSSFSSFLAAEAMASLVGSMWYEGKEASRSSCLLHGR